MLFFCFSLRSFSFLTCITSYLPFVATFFFFVSRHSIQMGRQSYPFVAQRTSTTRRASGTYSTYVNFVGEYLCHINSYAEFRFQFFSDTHSQKIALHQRFRSLVVAISTWRHRDLGSNPGRNPCEKSGPEFKARVGKLCPLLAFAIRTLLGTYPSTSALRTKFSDRPDVTFRLRIIATVPCESIGGHSRTTGNKSP